MNRCVNIELFKYLQPISRLSYDKKNKIPLCQYKNEFYAFEEIVKLKHSKELPNAVDMLYINDEKKEVWFVEFKNRKKDNIDKFDIKRKILDSLISFYELFDEILCCKYKKKYFVVYKCENDDIHLKLFNEFEDREIYFDLKEIENKFLEEVITDCCNNFLKEFEKRFNIEWMKG